MSNTLIDQTFQPGPDTSRALRDALGRFATGITLITTQTEHGPAGFTANSFASVSLDPALVLWSAARNSARFPIFAAAKSYSIHILAQDQADLAARFVRRGAGFDGLPTTTSADGSPILTQALARFDCHQHSLHDGGDHLIIVGRVTHFALRDGAPLLFSQGQYGQFLAQT
jgi:flavin reductase (DIM6/NTAB) family NADH-FMN oxidoreductase RutF